MSHRILVISSLTAFFAILTFTCVLENNYSLENAPLPFHKKWTPFTPANGKEAYRQFIVETVLKRCEKKCGHTYGPSMIQDLSNICMETCHEIWGFLSREKG